MAKITTNNSNNSKSIGFKEFKRDPELHSILDPQLTSLLKEDPKFDKHNLQIDRIGYFSSGNSKRHAFILEKTFSERECRELIQKTEQFGYSRMNIGDIRGQDLATIDAAIIDDARFTKQVFERIGSFLPSTYRDPFSRREYSLLEIDEQLRFIRLDEGKNLNAHIDGAYERPDGSARSWISLTVFLNEGFRGGRTRFVKWGSQALFPDSGNRVTVPLNQGSVLVHDHNILHETTALTFGHRYSLSMDVLYCAIRADNYEDDCCVIL